ncbi:MAG: NAD-binding protein [Bacteroidetes bacterium CG12_big_fil_rev_8_21_14_0_65_60_17]|nr:MAG: NAD-binding protein [Bacteroidetes bacterium CG12_big_fil_rev_8_21_14_0_65_60_17]
MQLTDKIALVTGASAGLGARISRDLVERGAHVYGLARREERLGALQEELGSAFTPLPADVTSEEDVRNAFSRIGGRLDILINNAGLGKFGPAKDTSTSDWDLQVNVNLRGVFLCTRAAIPLMQEQNRNTGFGGHIVNVSSVAGLMGNPNVSTYNVTKFGLKGYSEALFKELREDGIKVTCIFPGSIETEFFEQAGVPISDNPMTSEDVSSSVLHVLQTPDNYLVSEIVMRPLRPKLKT